MAQSRAPTDRNFKGNVASDYDSEIMEAKIHFISISQWKSTEDDLVKVVILLNLLDDAAIQIFNIFEFEGERELLYGFE